MDEEDFDKGNIVAIISPEGEEIITYSSLLPHTYLIGQKIKTKGFKNQNERPDLELIIDHIEYEIGWVENKESGKIEVPQKTIIFTKQ